MVLSSEAVHRGRTSKLCQVCRRRPLASWHAVCLLWEEWLIVISLLWKKALRHLLPEGRTEHFLWLSQVRCRVLLCANHSQEEVLLFAWGAQDLLRGSDRPWNSQLNEFVGSGWKGPKACSWHRQKVFWENYLRVERDRTGVYPIVSWAGTRQWPF